MVNESQEKALYCISQWIDIAEVRNDCGHTCAVYKSTSSQHEQKHGHYVKLLNSHEIIRQSAEEECLTYHCDVDENSVQKQQCNIAKLIITVYSKVNN